MGLEWEQLVVDARNSQRLGRWWAEALGWIIVYEDADEVRTAEVDRLLSLGAERIEIGQTGEEPWVVLADPEGNEFCVLSSRRG